MSVEVGKQAPDFTLRDENNEKITLSELKGEPVVLMFYPLDFSPLCTTEHCSMRDSAHEQFAAAGARVYGISRDSRWTHHAFKEKENLPYSLLADMSGDVARAYGTWSEEAGVAERLTVVIGPDGVVRHLQRTENRGQERDHSESVAALQSASR